MTGLVVLNLVGLAAAAFMYGCAKAEDIGWPADVAVLTGGASMVLASFFWEHDWVAITGGIGSLAMLALIAMANGWWKP